MCFRCTQGTMSNMPISHGYYETQKEHIIAMSDAAAEERGREILSCYTI